MRITKKQQVLQQVTIAYVCDICKIKIDSENLPDGWIAYTHGHTAWGNDSIDSIEHFEVCSIKCFKQALEKSFIEIGNDYGAFISISEQPIVFAKQLLENFK